MKSKYAKLTENMTETELENLKAEVRIDMKTNERTYASHWIAENLFTVIYKTIQKCMSKSNDFLALEMSRFILLLAYDYMDWSWIE